MGEKRAGPSVFVALKDLLTGRFIGPKAVP